MENKLLTQYNTVITSQWLSQQITEKYSPLSHREVFELAYHSCNALSSRCIFIKLAQDEDKGGSKAVLYDNNKTFITVESFDNELKATIHFQEGFGDKLANEISPLLKKRKEVYAQKDKDVKIQLLKTILVERKIDECANLVMLKDLTRKVYFAIGDARESAAVVPMFMEAEGASLVQLALNKWMSATQQLPMDKPFPDTNVQGLLKNLMQIKKWILNLVSTKLEK